MMDRSRLNKALRQVFVPVAYMGRDEGRLKGRALKVEEPSKSLKPSCAPYYFMISPSAGQSIS
jgi:hypothetical protein